VPNYEIQPGHSLIVRGKLLREGEILPDWYANWDGGLPGRIAAGCLAASDKRHTVEVAPAEVKVSDDPTAALYAEVDRLAKENAEYASSNRELAGRLETVEKSAKHLTDRLGKMTEELAHAEGNAETHRADLVIARADVERLTEELAMERATKPATKPAA